MKKYNKALLFIVFLIGFKQFSMGKTSTWSGSELLPNKNSTIIVEIKKDTLVLVGGKTYSYTVDTPEGQGVVSTVPTIEELKQQIYSGNGSALQYKVQDSEGREKENNEVVDGDVLLVTSTNKKPAHKYVIKLKQMAVGGRLETNRNEITAGTASELVLKYTAGQRTPDAAVELFIPPGIEIDEDNVLVNIIGRGNVNLRDIEKQSIGRTGSNYFYSKVGTYELKKLTDGGTQLIFNHLDLRPGNGTDLELTFTNILIESPGKYEIIANYTTSQPERLKSPGIGAEQITLVVKNEVTDFKRNMNTGTLYHENPDMFTKVSFSWTPVLGEKEIILEYSKNNGKNWIASAALIDGDKGTAQISGLTKKTKYLFRLKVVGGAYKGVSNEAAFYSGEMDIKTFGVSGDGTNDDTEIINKAIEYIHQLGGGVLLFSNGTYCVRTIHLKSNVWLYLENRATIKALKGADAPESTWFCDKKYRSGLSPTDTGPYEDPENYLTKQDVGHTYFRNAMFFGERLNNVKIIGNGRITGDGNLVTSDKVMNRPADNRADKMFSLKLCKNIEIGGIYRKEDLWYDSRNDKPFYLCADSTTDNMMQIDQGGHFVLLATGSDNIAIHNTYFGKSNTSHVRDIYDFMGCNNVTVTNIYCKVSSDDIVKLGSDCSLGFTRSARNYKIRNIIGDTNCNLFQIGSETADDITDVCVDNIYVLGANKAGFSISTNDGGHIKNIHLNCGHTGTVHSRSQIVRAGSPFFISISNRGRVLGANVKRFTFLENGETRDELLCTNVNIGVVDSIILNGVDVTEVYRGSSFRSERWRPYNGSQDKASPIVAGYSLPKPEFVQGNLDFILPNGKHTSYISNIFLNDINILVKGGNPLSDTIQSPKELGVGQYNVKNLGIQPSFGLWVRHAKNISVKNCWFNFEKIDSRYTLLLKDVIGAKIDNIKTVKAEDNKYVLKLINSERVNLTNCIYYNNKWGNKETILPDFNQKQFVNLLVK